MKGPAAVQARSGRASSQRPRRKPSLSPPYPSARRKVLRLLVATDFSPTARRALLFATRLAAPGGKVRLVHAVDPAVGRARGAPISTVPARVALAREARACHARGLRCGICTVLGRPERVLLREADAFRAAAIVCGTHGRRGLRRLLLGSVAERLLATARRPVLVVPHVSVRGAPRRILAATDFSRPAGAALAFASALARHLRARLAVVHVRDTAVLAVYPYTMGSVPVALNFEKQGSHARGRLEAIAAHLERGGLWVTPRLEKGYPPDRIAAIARSWRADLLVVGTRGLGGVGRFLLGSVSRELVRSASCPVAVVPEPHRRGRRGTILI